MERITLRLSQEHINHLEQMVEVGIFPNRSEGIRAAIRTVVATDSEFPFAQGIKQSRADFRQDVEDLPVSYDKSTVEMERITLRIPKQQVDSIERLADQMLHSDRDEVIRNAVRAFVTENPLPFIRTCLVSDIVELRAVTKLLLTLSEDCPGKLTEQLNFVLILVTIQDDVIPYRALQTLRNVYADSPEAFEPLAYPLDKAASTVEDDTLTSELLEIRHKIEHG